MEQWINPRVKQIQISGIRQFFNRVSSYPDAISLTLGLPDFPTPDHVKEAGKKAIDENKTTYTHNAGSIELRRSIHAFVKDAYNLIYRPEDEIIATSGASEAIDISLRTILVEGDEVILPGPVYPGYEPVIQLCGAKAVHVDTRDTEFKLTASKIKAHLTERTKCVILPYPSNPTGMTLSTEELEDIVELLKDRNVFILSDEIYSELTYDVPHQSIASYEGMKEKTIVINGLSKSHSMTGWRIGYLLGDSSVMKHILKVHQYNVTCVSSITQAAAIEALTTGKNDAKPMRDVYKERLDYTYNRLIDMGLQTDKPKGAFYLFPSIKPFNMDSWTFASKLLDEEELAVVPGIAFSDYGDQYIRISYAYHQDLLKEGLDRLERFIEKLKTNK
ncbi:aminotransferase A [Pseudalkalibacillus berkeleyi]|uniref:Aminotransferase n=1 Tax=Pseudalkalibacillus berkeleyi TaxID=1069813 RepID=A0ABS9GWV3_9BACL|nr:aminotransferase A [Pseudalkalibacillus berkeleyi]MCF6137262.1 aminotransferase A [Pseudalkalibacillus berkeleyi]